MLKIQFTLTQKRQLTHDVFELVYSCPELPKDPPKPGQYVLFQLDPGLNRAYSLASFEEKSFTLVIKKIPDGKWIPIICDAEVGTVFSGLISLGHFSLSSNPLSKCFIGTGTGFAPLYCQMKEALNIVPQLKKIGFVFGVRNFIDSFYEKEISELISEFEDWVYYPYFSRESDFSSRISDFEQNSRQGYVTDWIVAENIKDFEEFYICGSPVMVQSAREKLQILWIQEEKIFFEQF